MSGNEVALWFCVIVLLVAGHHMMGRIAYLEQQIRNQWRRLDNDE